MFDKITDMLKQAEEMQQKLATVEETGYAGSDLVSVTVNGHGEVINVDIDSSLLVEGDEEILGDLFMSATNDAKRKVQEKVQKKTQELMGGMPLPPGFKFPF